MYANALEENDLNTTLAFWTKLRHNIIFTPSMVMPSMAVSYMRLLMPKKLHPKKNLL
jgi:hypothetical protein